MYPHYSNVKRSWIIRLFITIFILFFVSIYTYAENSTYYVSSPNGLNMRTDDSYSSKVISLIPYKTELTVLGKSTPVTIDGFSGFWIKVRYLNNSGWVFSGYLSSKTPPPLSDDKVAYITKFSDSISDKGIQFNQITINFGEKTSAVLEKYGKPKSQVNNDSFGYMIYPDFALEFVDFLTPDKESPIQKNNKSKAIFYIQKVSCCTLKKSPARSVNPIKYTMKPLLIKESGIVHIK